MKPAQLPAAVIALLSVAASAVAQETTVMCVSDPASALPGVATVTACPGLLPPQAPTGRDITQMEGFPKTMGLDSYGMFRPSRGLAFADLDGDGRLEIIASSTDRKVYAWDHTGAALPGFPVTLNEMAQYAPSIGDLDGDGDLEIVQPTRGWTSGGRLYALDHTGQVLPGFPRNWSNNNVSSFATLYDLDGDGDLEIIANERAGSLGKLHVVQHDGSEWAGNWPVPLDHVPAATPAVGDVDGDGAPEILAVSYDSMYLLALDGTALPGWPRQIPAANFSYQSPALADLDGDGDLEIVIGAHKDAAGCYVFHHDGTSLPGWPKMLGTWSFCPPTVTDLEGDGVLEILDGRAGSAMGYSYLFWAWDVSGAVKPGFPYGSSLGGGSEGPLTVTDLNGDGRMEIFADHSMSSAGSGYLHGVDAAGNVLPGFPLRPRGATYMNGATIGDVDGDGDCELGVVSSHDTGADVNLYDLPDACSPYGPAWTTYHAHHRRGGQFHPGFGDADADGDVGLDDFLAFAECLTGPWQAADFTPPSMDCRLAFDLNEDGDVDLDEFAAFQEVFTD